MGSYTIELFWIMSRAQDFHKTEMFKKVVQKAVDEYGFRRELARVTPQEGPRSDPFCHYDYLQNDKRITNNLALHPALSFPLLIILSYISSTH